MLKIKLNETDSSFELTEESVRSLLDRLNLVIDNKWYDGNKSRPVFDCHDKFDELGETVCVFVEPPYEARVWYKDLNPRVNHYTEGIETLDELEEVLREFFNISPNESKQDEADYSASRVSKPIADAYSLLDEYFCDEDGHFTNDAVDRVYMVFRNERDLVDMSNSRRVKSHSLAWSALIRQINATLEWDDENTHATSLTSEQVKNWFKLKGRDYKEELKPLVAVIDAYRNQEY